MDPIFAVMLDVARLATGGSDAARRKRGASHENASLDRHMR
jgi:hypothetical protein